MKTGTDRLDTCGGVLKKEISRDLLEKSCYFCKIGKTEEELVWMWKSGILFDHAVTF